MGASVKAAPDAKKNREKKVNTGQVMFSGEICFY